MAGFSEEELLLLNNYIYFNCSTGYPSFEAALDAYSTGREKGEREFTPESFEWEACAGLSTEDAADIFRRLDKATGKGGSMEGLSIERVLDAGDIRAICVKKPSGEAAVIFRGTGGTYDAWLDNVRGEFIVDTKIQKMAADFIDYDCGGFKDLTVSGHSKGGNLAQYVAVVCGDRISDCVSFDGQGFNKDFIKAHEEEIEKARGKIHSVCAHNDYVNILLNSIAGETVYIKNKDSGAIAAHCAYSLIKYGDFDGTGRARRYDRNIQSPFIKAMKTVIDGIIGGIDLLPAEGNVVISELLGSIVATTFCCERDYNDVDEEGEIKKAALGLYEYVQKGLLIYDGEDSDVELCTASLYVDTDRISIVSESLWDMKKCMESSLERVGVIREELNSNIVADMVLAISIDRARERLERNMVGLHKICEDIKDILSLYSRAEQTAISC